MIRVVVADDQDIVRAGFRMILDATDDIEVVGEAGNGRDAVTQALHLRPDVCLFDIRMPDLDGIEATRQVAGPAVADPLKVVVITTFDMDDYVYGALRAGAVGFLLKTAGTDLLLEAIRAAHVGESLISPSITTRLVRKFVIERSGSGSDLGEVTLTGREEEVLAAVATGLTNAEIASSLHVSLSTAKVHVANLMAKLKARNRVELVVWAYQTGRAR